MPAAIAFSQAGWWLTAVLLLLIPLVQGGTPRLPKLVVEVGILVLVVAWSLSWGRAPRRELRLGALDALLGFLLFWALFSTLFAPYSQPAEAASLFLACTAALFWNLSFNPSFAGLSLALGAVRAQAAFQSVLVLGVWLGGGLRPAGTFFNPNFLAGFLAVALLLVIGQAVFAGAGQARRRPLALAWALAEGALLLAALLATGSRGGAIALFAGLLVLFSVRSWRFAAVGLTAAAAALLAIPNPLVQRLQSLPHTDAFAFTRLSIWKSAWSMMLDHPWLGVGLGQYEYVSPRYAFPVGTHWAKYTHIAENAHSDYLQAGAELGVPGLLAACAGTLLLAVAALRRLRGLAPGSRGPVATLLAGAVSIAAHSVVDFPLLTPPAALLLVLLAAGMRLHGVFLWERAVSFSVRPVYAAACALVALLLAGFAVRPVLGFWYFLGSIGAPQNLLLEKWSLESAPRTPPPPAESLRLVRMAARIDYGNAPYRRALGNRLFQGYLAGEGGSEVLRQALFEMHFAAELNPNNHRYPMDLGSVKVALARRHSNSRWQLREALAHYRRGAELAPFNPGIQEQIGLLADEVGEAPAAQSALRRAVQLEEYYLGGWLNLGAFYARHGRVAEAREAFVHGAALAEKAAALVPSSEAERALLAFKPEVFYDELKKLESQGRQEVSGP